MHTYSIFARTRLVSVSSSLSLSALVSQYAIMAARSSMDLLVFSSSTNERHAEQVRQQDTSRGENMHSTRRYAQSRLALSVLSSEGQCP
jgi:hypothetical protein